MEAQKDFKELLALFNAHKVDYVIVGAYALAFHGAPRYTGDLDILVRPDRENSERVLNALNAFGFASLGLTAEDFSSSDKVVQLGYPPLRVERNVVQGVRNPSFSVRYAALRFPPASGMPGQA